MITTLLVQYVTYSLLQHDFGVVMRKCYRCLFGSIQDDHSKEARGISRIAEHWTFTSLSGCLQPSASLYCHHHWKRYCDGQPAEHPLSSILTTQSPWRTLLSSFKEWCLAWEKTNYPPNCKVWSTCPLTWSLIQEVYTTRECRSIVILVNICLLSISWYKHQYSMDRIV